MVYYNHRGGENKPQTKERKRIKTMMKFMIRGFQTNNINKVYELVENAGGKVEEIGYCVGNTIYKSLAKAESVAEGKQIAIIF